MSIDLNYGRRTGVTSFKGAVGEVCETLHKFEPLIKAWVNSSAAGLSAPDQALIIALIAAVDLACAAVKAMKDD